ncbi:MAG TPA: cation-translocating P-type ATPase [Methylophilaceae bacterium]|jgi:Ca2+-transporting ATPase|nr:cation-translocating P-type ATPase [Methylophilaceae bacterium]
MTPAPDQAWHSLHHEDVARHLATDLAHGLTAAEAASRLEQHGPNALPEGKRRSPLRILLSQFADVMILVLLAAAAVSMFVGEIQDTLAIIVIVVLNAVIGFIQEYRTERAIAALRQMSSPTIRVRRDGEIATLPSHEIVPGDIVFFEAGNIVPADVRLAEIAHLRIAEAALTGESNPVEKAMQPLERADFPLGDRSNMAYKGTTVTYGRGSGIVVATGPATELGKIAGLLSGAKEGKTPLQKRLASFGGRLAVAVLAICVIVFAAGLLRGESPLLMFMTAVSLAVAAIPEALPAVIAVSLALGAYRMVGQKALVRRLPAVETLGSITFICSDKTGTLTQNRMHAEAFFANGTGQPAPDQPLWRTLFEALALNSDATLGKTGDATGDPTEIALLETALEHGADRATLVSAQSRVGEVPFDSERKCMTTLHRQEAGFVAYAKGAPESILQCCNSQLGSEGPVPLQSDQWQMQAETMAQSGLRVIAVAMRRFDALPEPLTDVERDLTLLGLVGLMDPPRPEAHHAVAECKTAGITPVMITGDHPATALTIARRLGIVENGGAVALTGADLNILSDDELRQRVENVRVYARVDPAQKIRIVDALQANGEFVAMTGDGVNDAPALKSSDIGVAMGKGGTDVARESAHMILLDDNFATIVHAVREGRRIFDNIRKFIKYAMTGNAGEIWVILLAPLFGLPLPLLPIHILWVNLVTDGLPGITLAVEPAERQVMQRPPRPSQESIFAHGMWQHIVSVGLLMGGVTLLTQAWTIYREGAHWQSMVFTVLTLSQLGHVLAVRSERESIFTLGFFSNRPLLFVLIATVALQMATLYVPVLNPIFRTEPLTASELAACFAISSVVFWGVEAEKWLVRRGWLYR